MRPTTDSAKSKNRRYWVVSPNVKNDPKTVSDWRQASVIERAAFMGWAPDDFKHGKMGPKFAGRISAGIVPGDVILIARRCRYAPEIVGFGVVSGDFSRKTKRAKAPKDFGALRRLSTFTPWSRPPSNIPLIDVLQHTKALVQLHPDQNESHRVVCNWMEERLDRKLRRPSAKASVKRQSKVGVDSPALSMGDLPESHQLDYKVQTRSAVIRAKKRELELVKSYSSWLERQGRKLVVAKYAKLQCDGYEKATNNLIEAKSSTTREHLRMAVGQLLDYAYQGRKRLGEPHKAILLPKKPASDMASWLAALEISSIWRNGKVFLDDANGRFT